MSNPNPNILKAAKPLSHSGYKYSGDDLSNLKATNNQEAQALETVQDKVFKQAEGRDRRQGVNVDVPAGSGGAFGPSAPGFGADGKDGITGNMTSNSGASVRPVTVRKVDQVNLITGQDFRRPQTDTAKESVDAISSNGGPREQMKGQQTQKNYKEDGQAFKSFPGNCVDQND